MVRKLKTEGQVIAHLEELLGALTPGERSRIVSWAFQKWGSEMTDRIEELVRAQVAGEAGGQLSTAADYPSPCAAGG